MRPGGQVPGRTSARMGQVSLYRDDAIVLRDPEAGRGRPHRHAADPAHRPGARGRARASAGRRRKFGARLEPFSHVDVQLFERPAARWTSITQAETHRPYGERLVGDYPRYTAGAAMLETAERLTPEEERALAAAVSCCCSARCGRCGGRARRRRWCSTRTCCARWRRRVGAGASTTARAAVRVPGAAPRRFSRRPRAAWSARPAAAAVVARRTQATVDLMRALLSGDWATADASRARGPPGGERPGRRAPAVAPGARAALAATGRAGAARSDEVSGAETTIAAREPSLARPGVNPAVPPGRIRRRAAARIPAELVPGHVAIVMDGNGRWAKQRGLPRTEGHEARRGRRCSTSSRAPSSSASRTCRPTRSPPRTGAVRRTRCAS